MRPIPNHPGYSVFESGKVYSHKSAKYLKWSFQNKGYPYVSLCHQGKAKHFLVHRLVALSYLPNPNGLPTVNHKNGDRRDPSLINLEWVTNKENHLHSFRELGRLSGQCRLTPSQAKEIDRLLTMGLSDSDIAAQFGVGRKAINKIKLGLRWSRVTGRTYNREINR